ncbi:unnamed protein product, partial [Prorocentrum cordatum]
AGVLSGRVSPAALPGEPPRARASARRAAGLAPRAPRAPGAARRRGVRTRCVATLLQPATQKTKVGAPGALRPGSRAVQATGHEGRREVHPPESLLEERERGRPDRNQAHGRPPR